MNSKMPNKVQEAAPPRQIRITFFSAVLFQPLGWGGSLSRHRIFALLAPLKKQSYFGKEKITKEKYSLGTAIQIIRRRHI